LWFAASSGEVNVSLACIVSLWISASEYRYGTARRGGSAGSRSVGGTSVRGSRVKPRTTDSRWRQYCGIAFDGCIAHASASSLVMHDACASSA
jgi:hypothetical protein